MSAERVSREQQPEQQGRQHERSVGPAGPARAPAGPTMHVGSADHHLEADAERRAHEVMERLALQEPLATSFSGASIQRSTAAAPSGGAIGREGGQLDAGAQHEIESARGGGRPLHDDVRTSMESAFGASLRHVRVHDDPKAASLSRSMSATAFTTGSDIFFGAGAYDPSSAQGRHVLAHELAHVVQNGQGVHRLWNPFKKSDKKKAKEAEAKERARQIKANRAAMKEKDKQVRLEAKRVNQDNKEISTRIKGAYAEAGDEDPTFKPEELARLEKTFQTYLDREKAARKAARDGVLDGQEVTDELRAEAEAAEEEAAEKVWDGAPVRVRAFRPLTFDEFDKALNEVRQAKLDANVAMHGEVAHLMEENEANHGVPLTVEKAEKKVREVRQLERRKQRALARGKGPLTLGRQRPAAPDPQQASAGSQGAGNGWVSARPSALPGPSQWIAARPTGLQEQKAKPSQDRPASETRVKALEEQYGQNETLLDAKEGVSTTGKVIKAAGKVDKRAQGALVGSGLAQEGMATDVNDVLVKATGPLDEICKLVSTLLTFATQISDINKGVAAPGARLDATRTVVQGMGTAARGTVKTLKTIKVGLEHFEASAEAVASVNLGLPIVGIVVDSIGAVDTALEMYPIGKRVGSVKTSLDEAVLEQKAPLAASMKRIQSRNAQMMEKATFKMAKHLTMLGAHIAEIATAGGYGIPAAAKLGVRVIDLSHSLGHKIYDTVNESRSSTAKKRFGVKHEEGASRDVLKYDIGSSVDVLVVAAQKHKLAYARKALRTYGLTETDIDGMDINELREHVLDKMHAEGDPKTVTEKVQGAVSKVKGFLGIKEEHRRKGGEEKSTLDKIKEAPGKVADKIKELPGKVSDQIEALEEKHKDAKALADIKNQEGYHGKKDRGRGAVLMNFLRGSDKVEKSYAKVRYGMAQKGVDPKDLPRTIADTKNRDEKAAQIADLKVEKSTHHRVDKEFIQKVSKATLGEMYTLWDALDKNDPEQIGNMEYFKWEIDRRLVEAGSSPIR
jgi:hypothetical protein